MTEPVLAELLCSKLEAHPGGSLSWPHVPLRDRLNPYFFLCFDTHPTLETLYLFAKAAHWQAGFSVWSWNRPMNGKNSQCRSKGLMKKTFMSFILGSGAFWDLQSPNEAKHYVYIDN